MLVANCPNHKCHVLVLWYLSQRLNSPWKKFLFNISLFWKLEFLKSSKRSNWIWKHYFHYHFFSKESREKSSFAKIIVGMFFPAFLIFFTEHTLNHFLQSYFFYNNAFLAFFLPFMIAMLPHYSFQFFSLHDLHILCSSLWTRAPMSLSISTFECP